MYSTALTNILARQEPNTVAIILSDAVISTTDISREASDLKAVLARYINHSAGLFQYSLPFHGTYYPQPDRYRYITGVHAKRNLYALTLGETRFNRFLGKLLTERGKPNTSQFFNAQHQDAIHLEPYCSDQLITHNQLKATLKVDNTTGYKIADLRDHLEVLDADGAVLTDASITVQAGAHQRSYTVTADLSAYDALLSSYRLRINHTTS